MGVKISKTSHKAIANQRPQRKSEFLEDVDDANNMLANRRKSVHYVNIIQPTHVMLENAETDSEKAEIYNMKGDYYFAHANELRQKNNFDCFTTYRKSMTMFKTANEYNKNNIKSILGIARCLVNLHQYGKALKHLDENSKLVKLAEIQEFWILAGICRRKCAKIWAGNSKISNKFENLPKANQCLNKALELGPCQNQKLIEEKRIVDNLLRLQTEHKKDIYAYINSMKDIKDEVSCFRQKSEKEFYKILSIDGGGMR
jgi:tetratricopeptide (TPR) repeat protein